MLGIIGALDEEIAPLVEALTARESRSLAGREFHTGNLFGQPAVLVRSRLGKVAAAITATHLVSTFRVDAVIFTGVAGAVDPALRIGDIVVAQSLYQHDMDASPLFPALEIPLLGRADLPTDSDLSTWIHAAAERFVEGSLRTSVEGTDLRAFNIVSPRVVRGDVATGDQFIASSERLADLRRRVPSAACVEMEGAAVAQVCHEHGVPVAVIRTISDTADHTAPTDFSRFVRSIAGHYASGVMRAFIQGPA